MLNPTPLLLSKQSCLAQGTYPFKDVQLSIQNFTGYWWFIKYKFKICWHLYLRWIMITPPALTGFLIQICRVTLVFSNNLGPAFVCLYLPSRWKTIQFLLLFWVLTSASWKTDTFRHLGIYGTDTSNIWYFKFAWGNTSRVPSPLLLPWPFVYWMCLSLLFPWLLLLSGSGQVPSCHQCFLNSLIINTTNQSVQ